jgi:hypothetical protein
LKSKQRVIGSRKDVPAGFISAREVLKLHGDTVYNLALNAARANVFESMKVMTTPTDKRGPVFFAPEWKKHVQLQPAPAPAPIKIAVKEIVKSVSTPESGTIDLKLQEKIARNQEIMIDVLLRIEAAQLRQEKIWTAST